MASRRLGTIREIWRFPVKSMGGETVERARITTGGIPGDRGYALYDEEARQVRNAKLLPRLLLYSARYLDEPQPGKPAPVEITAPGGRTFFSDDTAGASAAISVDLGRRLRLSPLEPASNEDHYRRGRPDHADPIAQARATFALENDEPLPSGAGMATLPGFAQLREFATPPGTYFDVAPLHVVTTSALRSLEHLNPASDADRRRFRANLLVETDDDGFPEFDWCGSTVRAGDAVLEIRARTVRCAMPTHAQPGLERATSIMRTLVRETGQDLGVYALVAREGDVRVGDDVLLED